MLVTSCVLIFIGVFTLAYWTCKIGKFFSKNFFNTINVTNFGRQQTNDGNLRSGEKSNPNKSQKLILSQHHQWSMITIISSNYELLIRFLHTLLQFILAHDIFHIIPVPAELFHANKASEFDLSDHCTLHAYYFQYST